MSDNMISIFDYEVYFNKILSTANEVTVEISEQKMPEASRLFKSMQEIDDAILQAMLLCHPSLNLSVQTKDGLDNLVTVLDDTYALINRIYSKTVN